MQFQNFAANASSFCMIVSNSNLDMLKVPSKFVEEGLGNEFGLYHNAILHGPINQIRMVKLLKTGNGKLYLTDGLRQFIEENSIKNYDTLLFNHRGNMCFVVSVMAVMMTEKLPAIAPTPLEDNPCQVSIGHGSSKEKSHSPDAVDGLPGEAMLVCNQGGNEGNKKEVQGEKKKRGKPRKYRSMIHLLTSSRPSTEHVHGNDNAPNLGCNRELVCMGNEGNKTEVQGEKRKRGRPRKDRSMIHHSTSSRPSTTTHVHENDNAPNPRRKRQCNPVCNQRGSEVIKKEVQGEKRKPGRPRKDRSMILHPTSSRPSTKNHVHGHENAPNLGRKRQCNPDKVNAVPDIKIEQSIIPLEHKFISQFPFFECSLGPDVYQKFMLNIPKEFFVKHLSHSISVILRNAEQKCWIVSVIPVGKGHAFSKGFKAFFLQNKLEIGDKCVFELVEDNVMEFYVFH